MPNQFKIYAKSLMVDCATKYLLTPTQLLKLFHYAAKVPGSNLRTFAALLAMSRLDSPYKTQIHDFVHGRISEVVMDQTTPYDVDQPFIDRCNFLYHAIDNFYIRGVQAFDDLSFYPRLEDLFAKIPDSEKISKPEEQTKLVTKTIKWNKQQTAALEAVYKWLRTKGRKQVFKLFGYAGTGKTELAKTIADFVMNEGGKQNVPRGGVLFSAYTGKACSVLRVKGCRGADTLHSFLYKPVIDPDTGICTGFILNGESPLSQCALLIIDEASMVNEEMGKDIESFGCAILILGDPAQLKPVKGEGYFTTTEPDIMLTDIERQAKDNPIIYLATRARKQLEIKAGKYGTSTVYEFGTHLSDELYVAHDQIICGLNVTRRTVNKRMRRINGTAERSIYPVEGEKIICLKNNKTSGLYNGTMWTASAPSIQKIMRPIFKGSNILRPGEVDVLAFTVSSMDEVDPQGKPYVIKTQCSLHYFNENMPEPEYRAVAGSDQFDFGWGISGHKSQASQWGKVLLIDESNSFRDQKWHHLYTTITRAADLISIIL